MAVTAGFSESERLTQRKSKRTDRGLRLQPNVRRISVQNAKAKVLYHIAQFQEVLDTLSKFLSIYRQTEKIVGAGLDRALDIFNVI